MTKQTMYRTTDGKEFPTRQLARRHELDLHRVARLGEYFARYLPAGRRVGPAELAAAILANPKDFLRRLSARAARRQLAAPQLTGTRQR
jgi:hypothetical protein